MDIKFKAVESGLGTMRAEARCTGRIVHNAVLGPEEIAQEISRSNGIDAARAGYMSKVVSSYIVQALGEGKRLDFGPFTLMLTLKGSVKGVNGAFEEVRNSIGVKLLPQEELRKALSGLHPVNATPQGTGPRIASIMDCVKKTDGEIRLDTEIYVAGANLLTEPGSSGEGVWLRERDGDRILKGRILRSTSTTLDCIFDAPAGFSPGTYRFELAARNGDPAASPASCSRIVKVGKKVEKLKG